MTETDKMIQKMYKGRIADRILLIVILVFTIGNFILLGVVGIRIKEFTEQIEPAINVINQLDVEEFNKTLTTLNNAIDFFKVNEVIDTLSQVDFTEFTEVMSNIDVDKLNQTLENIQGATEFMKNIGTSLKDFLSQFSFGR